MTTLKDHLTAHMRRHHSEWIASGTLQRMVWKNRTNNVSTPQTVGRELRYLEEQKLLAVKYVGSTHHAHYKALPGVLRPFYIPSSQRLKNNPHKLFTISDEDVKRLITRQVAPHELSTVAPH